MQRGLICGAAAGAALVVGCADPCVDDGLSQDNQDACPAVTGTESDSATGTGGQTESDSMTASMSGMSMSGDATASGSGGGGLWCVDADGDGFGDPDDCMMTDDPPDGSVDNDDDCDDGDENTFPGAAPNDDERACMKDGDGDDWGDDDPPDGVDAGTDCDDDDELTFPGAAANEPRDACTKDQDGDGWGDAAPGGGIDPGADCFDMNPALNPDTLTLAALADAGLEGDVIAEVAVSDAALTTFVPLNTPIVGGWNPVSSSLSEDGEIYVSEIDDDTLATVDYAGFCAGDETEGTVMDLPMGHGLSVVCGVAFGPDGTLYGLDIDSDQLVTFDLATGEVVDTVDVTLDGSNYDVGSCGMTYDCHEQRLLWASGTDGNVYGLDTNGEAELLADVDGTWTPTGVAYDPVARQVYLAGDDEMYEVQIDGSDQADLLGNFSFGFGNTSVSNLDYFPVCR